MICVSAMVKHIMELHGTSWQIWSNGLQGVLGVPERCMLFIEVEGEKNEGDG